MLHQKLPLDTRPIPRPIHEKICPLSALSVHSNSIIRHARLLKYGDATVAPVFPSEHSNHIFESVRQLRYGVPQQLQHHQARTSAPRAHASAPVWGAAAAPHHQARTQLPEHIRQLWCGAPQLLLLTKAYTQLRPLESARQLRCGVPQQLQHHQVRTSAPRVHASASVWGASATPSSPSTHVNSRVGCHRNSIITKRIHTSSP